MTLPRRRRSRPKGRARLNLAGDFPDNGETVTEILDRVRPAGYDGRTWQWGGANNIGLMPAPVSGPPPAQVGAYRCPRCRAGNHCNGATVNCDCPCASLVLAGRQAPWVMTVNTEAPAIPMDTRLRRTRQFLDLKVDYLKARGMGYRIDDAEQVLQRGEDLPAGSVIADTHAEAVTHLLGDHGIWEPKGGWNHGWADGLPWYRPEDGDNGLPLSGGDAS